MVRKEDLEQNNHLIHPSIKRTVKMTAVAPMSWLLLHIL